MKVAGVLGALTANIGAMTPTLTLGFAAAAFFDKFRKSKTVECMLTGVRPTCVGMVCAVVLSLAGSSYMKGASLNLVNIAIGAVCALLLWRFKFSIPRVIGVSAVLGFLAYYVIGLPML